MTRVILSTPGAGSYTIPADWDSSSNTIELLGSGADGTLQFSPGGYAGGGQGGGGGQYSKLTNFVASPGDVISYHVGTAGGSTSTGAGIPSAPQPGDSYFGDPTTTGVFAQGAYYTPTNISHGGSYGFGLIPQPAWIYNNGGSVVNVDAAQAANGGGGAGGPNGEGGGGGDAAGLWEGGSGGGGANGGARGDQNFNSGGGFVGLGGGNGGNNWLGVGGGLGSYGTLGGPSAYAAPGTAGGGGGGGYGRSGINTPPGGAINAWHTNGGNGSTDAVWGGIYGPGSGGGGGGGGNDLSGGPIGGNGGNGGQFGGGGGGAATGSGTPGSGGQGLIVISYRGSGSADGKGTVKNRYVKSRRGGPRPPPAPPPTAPVNSGSPVMNQARVGLPSTCSTGTWTGTAPITFSYEWSVAGLVVGTNLPSYTPVSGDTGKSLKCTVTATNVAGSASHDSNAVTVTNSVGPSIDIPDVAALWAAQAAWPATGNKTWRLTGTDYGALGAYGTWRFDSAPVVIDGLDGSNKFQWIEAAGSSGITWQNFNVYGTNPSSGAAMWVHSDNVTVMNMTFNNVTVISTDAMGTQTQGGWILRNLDGSTIAINGRNDKALPDMWGCTFGISMLTVGLGGSVTINGMTFDNMGINSILGGGAVNVTVNSCLFMNNFYGVGDHPNAVHFFGDGTRESQNITCTNNGVWQGLSGGGSTGFFRESVQTGLYRNNWVLCGRQNGAFSNSAGSDETNDNNFAQGFAGQGGVMIARGGAVNSINTNNMACAIANYAADGVNPGYVPATLPGTNTVIPAAASVTDYTYLDPWLAAHPTARPRP